MPSRTGTKGVFSVTGLEGMKAITQSLAMMEATKAGADWDGGMRQGDGDGPIVSNARIMKYLADGNSRSTENRKTRDIRPNEEDGRKAVQLFSDDLVRHLQRVGRVVNGNPITIEKQATAGIIGGLRKAAKYIAKVMYERVEKGVDNKGHKENVGKEYAKQRNRKWGIADDTGIVLKASLQLANALQRGKIKIRFDKSGLGKAARIFKRG
jgi:hypothetical protein